MSLAAGHVPLAQELAQFVAESSDTTSAATATTTETLSSSITFTAFSGVRYKCTYQGNVESTVAGDGITLRLRWANSGTPGTGGTQFAVCGHTSDTAGKGQPFVLVGTFSAQAAGTLTISATIVRAAGTGTVKQNAASNNGNLYFLVEIVGPA